MSSFNRPMTTPESALFTTIKASQDHAQLRNTLTQFRTALSARKSSLALAIALCGLSLSRSLHNKPQSEPTLFSDPEVGYRRGRCYKDCHSPQAVLQQTARFRSNLMEFAFLDGEDFSTPVEWDLAAVETAYLAEGEALVAWATASGLLRGDEVCEVMDEDGDEDEDVVMTLDTDDVTTPAPVQLSELPFRDARSNHPTPQNATEMDLNFIRHGVSALKFKQRPSRLNLAVPGAVPRTTRRRQPDVQLCKQRKQLKRKLNFLDLTTLGTNLPESTASSMAPPMAKKRKTLPAHKHKTRPDSPRPDCGFGVLAVTFPLTYGFKKGRVATVKRMG